MKIIFYSINLPSFHKNQHQHEHHSEILYIVFITIKCALNALYIVSVLIGLHLSSTVINTVSRCTSGEQV